VEIIKKQNDTAVRRIFTPLESFQPMCSAVLEGVYPGEIWVDDSERPIAALLVTFLPAGGAAWCFLAGKPDQEKFNRAINRHLFSGEGSLKEAGAFLFTCTPEDWDGQLGVIGDPRPPIPMLRQHYRCREMVYGWRGSLPDGFAIQPMTVDLLQKGDLQLPPLVKATLGKWRSIDEPRFRDYGFIVLHENRVVSWATVDFVSGGSGDLGFETLPEYQQRGLGSAVAAAALEHGLEMGIEVHWTCDLNNLGSQKTARKLGLIHDRDYTMYLFARDMSEHLAQRAYSFLAQKEYHRAIQCYEDLFAQKATVPTWAYFDTAQAWAALGGNENAIKYLRMAAKEGWSAVEIVEQAPEFKFLHGLPEWAEVINHMRQNQRKSP
jgi:GNAT superfamily N-acetyltransferase